MQGLLVFGEDTSCALKMCLIQRGKYFLLVSAVPTFLTNYCVDCLPNDVLISSVSLVACAGTMAVPLRRSCQPSCVRHHLGNWMNARAIARLTVCQQRHSGVF